MDWNQLAGLALTLLLVGMVVGVGVLTLDKFATASKVDTTVTDEAVTITSGEGQLTYDDVTEINSFYNATNASQAYTLTSVNWSTQGQLALAVLDGSYNCSYHYDKDTAGVTSVIVASSTAVDDIANDWMTLIVTVAILAVILGLVIGAFAFGRGGR